MLPSKILKCHKIDLLIRLIIHPKLILYKNTVNQGKSLSALKDLMAPVQDHSVFLPHIFHLGERNFTRL
jgi:hypothetical protein